jgi:hypothetical protein
MADLTQSGQSFLSGTTSPHEIVKYIEHLSHSREFYSMIQKAFSSSVLKKVIREIGFLRRAEMACAIFTNAARKISSPQRIKIHLLTGFQPKTVPPSPLPFPLQVTSKLQKRLENELRKPKWVHAEIRMVTHLISEDNEVQPFHYLGISKKTCFSCGRILSSLGMFRTRGNHGKVWCQWTLPSCVFVQHEFMGRLQYPSNTSMMSSPLKLLDKIYRTQNAA